MRRAYTAEGLNLPPDSDELPLDRHLIGIDQDFGRNTLLQQLLEVAATQALQHLGLLCRRRPEMALNKPSAQEPPSTLAL